MKKTDIRSGEAQGLTGAAMIVAGNAGVRPGRSRVGGGRIYFVAALLALLATPVAGEVLQATEEQREACTPDALNLCQAYIPDAERIRECLAGHIKDLSPSCRQVFAQKEKPDSK